jgi:large subunit ribosomal protein L17
MRHRVDAKQFNRDANHRKALMMNLVRNLLENGFMVTTIAKAKITKRLADKYIHTAQTDSIASRRNLHRVFGKRDIVNTLVEKIAPAMKDRQSGFVTSSVVGPRRGDNTTMIRLELINKPATTGFQSGRTFEKKETAPVGGQAKVKAKPVNEKAASVEAKKPVEKKAAPVATKKTVAKKTTATKKAK